MVDYRFVLETLYKYRGSKSGKNWLCFIDEIEALAPEERYVELRPYIDIIAHSVPVVKGFFTPRQHFFHWYPRYLAQSGSQNPFRLDTRLLRLLSQGILELATA